MNDYNTIQELSLDFRRSASRLLQSAESDGLTYLKRFYSFLNEQVLINELITTEIMNSQYEGDYFTQNYEFVIPSNESDHIKIMFDFLGELAESADEYILKTYAFNFCWGTGIKKYDEQIRFFLRKAFKELVDFITDSLSKKIMQSKPNPKMNPQIQQNIYGNNSGTINAGTTINSTNNILQNDLKVITDLIQLLKSEIAVSTASKEEKDSALDYLETIEEQVISETPKIPKLKNAIKGIKDFTSTAIFTQKVVENIQSLISSVAPYVGC